MINFFFSFRDTIIVLSAISFITGYINLFLGDYDKTLYLFLVAIYLILIAIELKISER